MKLIKLISLSKHHEDLCNKIGWYSRWHKHPRHQHAHWLTFFVFVLFSFIIVYNSYVVQIQAGKDKEINVEVCHMPSQPDSQAIIIAQSALQAHLDHGDTVGKCAEVPIAPEIPEIPVAPEIPEIPIAPEAPATPDVPENPAASEVSAALEAPIALETAVVPEVQEASAAPDIPAGPASSVFSAADILDVTSPIRNKKYRTGRISIHIVFSQPVEVNGSPQLALATGNPEQTFINYETGSGTDTLIFVYDIASSNFSSDLDYISIDSLSLNNGSIEDFNGNTASLILPAPGSAHSLGGNKDIVIDTIVRTPTVFVL